MAGYCVGKAVGEGLGLEYRFWVDTCFRIWVWFVPILFVGAVLLKTCIRQWKIIMRSLWDYFSEGTFTEVSYLDNDFELMLTSKMLKEHREVFASHGVELVSYLYGQTSWNPQGQGICTAVRVSEENKEQAAEVIAEFIKITLQEDLRPDGKSIWDCVDGSIFLVTDTREDGKYQSIRNIPFGLSPEYTWIYDVSVTAEKLAEEIVIKNRVPN